MSLAVHNRGLGFGGRKGSRVGIWFPWEFSAGGAWKFWVLSCFELRHIKSEVAKPEHVVEHGDAYLHLPKHGCSRSWLVRG